MKKLQNFYFFFQIYLLDWLLTDSGISRTLHRKVLYIKRLGKKIFLSLSTKITYYNNRKNLFSFQNNLIKNSTLELSAPPKVLQNFLNNLVLKTIIYNIGLVFYKFIV